MALTGSLVGNTCFASLTSAKDFYFSSIVPPLYPHTKIKVFKDPVTGNWIQRTVDYSTTGTWLGASEIQLDSNFIRPSCDPLQPFLDGTFLGFSVAAAVITVSLFAVLRRAL